MHDDYISCREYPVRKSSESPSASINDMGTRRFEESARILLGRGQYSGNKSNNRTSSGLYIAYCTVSRVRVVSLQNPRSESESPPRKNPAGTKPCRRKNGDLQACTFYERLGNKLAI